MKWLQAKRTAIEQAPIETLRRALVWLIVAACLSLVGAVLTLISLVLK